jgi:uncharacterized iron-regulated protein
MRRSTNSTDLSLKWGPAGRTRLGDVPIRQVRRQRLRDAQLAHVALEALEETGGPVVVITGTGTGTGIGIGHARRDWGVPALIARNDPGIRVLSLGQVESDPGRDAPFDLWIVTPAPAREDPCLAFAPPDAPPDAGPGG